jgi:hypothetical protein
MQLSGSAARRLHVRETQQPRQRSLGGVQEKGCREVCHSLSFSSPILSYYDSDNDDEYTNTFSAFPLLSIHIFLTFHLHLLASLISLYPYHHLICRRKLNEILKEVEAKKAIIRDVLSKVLRYGWTEKVDDNGYAYYQDTLDRGYDPTYDFQGYTLDHWNATSLLQSKTRGSSLSVSTVSTLLQ